MKICCVVPTIRPERFEKFLSDWTELFQKHQIILIRVNDGDHPTLDLYDFRQKGEKTSITEHWYTQYQSLVFRHSDVVRNLGILYSATFQPEYLLSLDDDVAPIPGVDPIQQHLDVLLQSVPLSWMNTAHHFAPYLRGFPYSVRNESKVVLSHGVWTGVPDFDGETQLYLEQSPGGLPQHLPYYVGPIPRGVLYPMCGMNVMIHASILPFFYFAPMGPDTQLPLHRFGDIWLGVILKRILDSRNLACFTGNSIVCHTRASDAVKNMELEKQGREWMEDSLSSCQQKNDYFKMYDKKLDEFHQTIIKLLTKEYYEKLLEVLKR